MPHAESFSPRLIARTVGEPELAEAWENLQRIWRGLDADAASEFRSCSGAIWRASSRRANGATSFTPSSTGAACCGISRRYLIACARSPIFPSAKIIADATVRPDNTTVTTKPLLGR